MPYYVEIDGMEEISEMLAQLEAEAPKAAAKALYEGAHIMSEAIIKEMDAVKTAPFEYAKDGQQRLPSPEEKALLAHAGVGIAKFDKNGAEIDTSVGFNQSGYEEVGWHHMSSQARTNYKNVNGKSVGSGKARALKMKGTNMKPIGAVANAINSGTSFMRKQPFVRKGMKAGGPKAAERMKAIIEEAFDNLTK